MLSESRVILQSLKGVDDLRNDDQVEVEIYANAYPICDTSSTNAYH